MQIRSFARALPTDRRIYRIDRWTIPLPGGLPLAASAWFLALAIALLALGQLPGARTVVAVVGWPAAMLVAPGAGAITLTRRCNDGRTLPHLAANRMRYEIRQRTCPSHARAPQLPQVLVAIGDATLPGRVRLRGPGVVSIARHALIEPVGDRIRLRASGTVMRANAVAVKLGSDDVIEVVR